MSRTKGATIPRSHAKSAWGLLQDVKRAILALSVPIFGNQDGAA